MLLLVAATTACHQQVPSEEPPGITLTKIPEARAGGPEHVTRIAGRTTGARPGQRVVLYAKSGLWWVQPTRNAMFTAIAADQTWQNDTHYGWQYAALLVDAVYQPSRTLLTLPAVSGHVLAKATSEYVPEKTPEAATIEFSGYHWVARQTQSDRGGTINDFNPKNAWVDRQGRLHLRITRGNNRWQCAEIHATRSLGYGTYTFVMQEVTPVEPAGVMAMYTFDEAALEANHREMNIEISRSGASGGRAAQFTVQPFYIPANVVRYPLRAGPLRYAMRWLPGRVDFTVAPAAPNAPALERTLASQSFTWGVPSPGKELLYIGLYAYTKSGRPLTHETEVIVDGFEYLP